MAGLVLIDSHAFFWHASQGSELSRAARRAMDAADIIGVSAITPWELAVKASKGKLGLSRSLRDWLDEALRLPKIEILPLTPEIAVRAVEIRGAVGPDPADAIIVATALVHGCRLVTRDARIQDSMTVTCVW